FKGELVTWQLLTAPEAGSDLAGTTTEAVRDGDEYVLNGEKIFIGGSHGCDMMWTIARTGPKNERHKNLSWFMIPSNTPGVTIRPMDMLGDGGEGIGGGNKNTIYFENARVPASALVGGENNGWQVASTHLELEHGGGGRISKTTWANRTLGWMQDAKKQGFDVLGDQQARERLVDIFVHAETSRLFGLRNFWKNRTHQPTSYEGSQGSYYGKIHGLDITTAMHDAFGPYGITGDEKWDVTDGEMEQYQRRAIVALHPAGTADIQKVIMARRIGMGRDETESAGKTVE
ncbi:MAG: acyl-CoA dehydrogenase family protein, partial [Vicinamibacterales bacterium]